MSKYWLKYDVQIKNKTTGSGFWLLLLTVCTSSCYETTIWNNNERKEV